METLTLVFKKLKDWTDKNKLEFFLILAIVLFGGFLRFYKISGYATFLGDEGRDAIVVKRMIVDHRFTLLGPTTSLGHMYLGPLYYYLMAIPLWLTRLDPSGPAMMVAGIGTLTILLIWFVGREFFSPVAGLVASSLYAVSLLVISHTRSSWNPNPMPFFTLLAIYGLFKALRDKDGRFLALVGASLGVAFQLHLISFVLMGIVFLLFLFYSFFYKIRFSFKWYLLGVFSFLLVILPQILFELRHNFICSKAIFNFVSGRQEAEAGLGMARFMPFLLYRRLFTSLLASRVELLGDLIASLVGVTALGISFKNKGLKDKNLGLFILLVWTFLGVLGIPLYEGRIHDHYLGFLFPTPFLLFGFLVGQLWQHQKRLKPLLAVSVLAMCVFAFLQTDIPKRVGPNYQIQRTKLVSSTIAEDVATPNFNLALLSPTKDFQALHYRYFLDLFGKKPRDYGQYEDIETLYVIVEVDERLVEELGLWEVGTFGAFEVEKRWDFDFQVRLFKLKHKI